MGRPRLHTPEQLLKLYENYKVDRKKVKFERPELIKSGIKAGEVMNVEISAPETLTSYCHYIGVELSTFYKWLNPENVQGDEDLQKEYFKVSTHIQDSIKEHQLSGASVGIYNSQIVARINGLKDTTEVQNTGTTQQINISIAGTDAKLD